MKDFIVRFNAWNILSKCHVRILEEYDKPITVICSQMFDNEGGSVTNYLEEIRAAVQQELHAGVPSTLDLMREALPRVDADGVIDAILAVIMQNPSYPLRLTLKTIPLAWKVYSEHRNRVKRIDYDLVWIEHYPRGTLRTLFNYDRYTVVDIKYLKWQEMSLSDISKRTGYPLSLLQKDVSLLKE